MDLIVKLYIKLMREIKFNSNAIRNNVHMYCIDKIIGYEFTYLLIINNEKECSLI